MLTFDWEAVEDEVVTAVVGQKDDGGAWDAIALIIDGRAVTLTVNPDTDELIVDLLASPCRDGTWLPVDAFKACLGKRLGWCWVGRNYRGYFDSFSISLDGIDPQWMFVGLASRLSIKRVAGAQEA